MPQKIQRTFAFVLIKYIIEVYQQQAYIFFSIGNLNMFVVFSYNHDSLLLSAAQHSDLVTNELQTTIISLQFKKES